jgi:hypothetical protein
MRAYNTATPENNPDAAPAVPTYRWSYEQRARLFGNHNPEFKTGRGRARRWRRELSTRAGLRAIHAVMAGERGLTDAVRLTHTTRELLYAPLDGRTAPVLYARERVRTLLDQLVKHGPASGWGIPQPVRSERSAAKWTPYVVPKTAEKCWRWWRARVRALLALLRHLDALWRKPVPLHREASSTTSGRETEVVLEPRAPAIRTRYRDQFTGELGAILERVQRKFGA